MNQRSVIDPAFINAPNIDWGLLAKAGAYFTSLNYSQIEVPWCVPETISIDTRPHGNRSFVCDNDLFAHQPHELVGSAEQGFMYLIGQNDIPPGHYWSISPCFRFDLYDTLHLPWFMKLELCHILDTTTDATNALLTMLDQCRSFLNDLGCNCSVVKIDETYDIEINGIEVGSYGIRETNNGRYIYGTGLALPRLTLARNNE